jgi:hypothetical protein
MSLVTPHSPLLLGPRSSHVGFAAPRMERLGSMVEFFLKVLIRTAPESHSGNIACCCLCGGGECLQ